MALSSFFELGIGTSGLLASQRALVTTGNNVTNANTEGYSRQVVTQKASKALSAQGAGMIGSGTEVIAINRVRDSYLDSKYRLQNNKLAEYTVKAEKMKEISLEFNEPSETGINSVINEVFTSLQNLSTNTSNSSYFEYVSNSLESLLETVNNIGQSLAQEQSLVNDEVSYAIDEINAIASQIQALNIQILTYEINGDEASSLRDERDLLVNNLSEYVNVTTEEMLVEGTDDVKKFTVKINGQELVSHDRVNMLKVEKMESFLNPEDGDFLYNVKWENGFEFDEYSSTLSGKLKALIEVRDGNCNNQMTGSVLKIEDNTTTGEKYVTIENVSRADIGENGMINIYGKNYIYTDSVYDKDEKTLKVTLAETNEFRDDFNTNAIHALARVGTDVDYRGIPYYVNKLNEFVRTVAGAINDGIYRNGNQIDGLSGSVNGYNQDGESGIYLITYKDSQNNPLGKGDYVDYEKMNIYNMSLSRELQEDSRNIPISSVQNPAESQADLVNELASLSHIDVFNEGEIADYMTSIISEVAMDVNQAERYQGIQANLVQYTDNRIQEVSGVDNNEEMTNLVKYQSAYKASARIITVMNSVYDTLINGIWN